MGFKDVDLIKVVTGVRHSGKSSLLDLFENHLIHHGVKKKNIIHMNMESLDYHSILDYLPFYNYVKELLVPNEKNYLIFDELQAVRGWEKAIESFRLNFDVDIYIAGSNSYLLSSEFSTLLSGRYVEIKLLPLSFAEFLTFFHFEPTITIDEKFQTYLQFGGMQSLNNSILIR